MRWPRRWLCLLPLTLSLLLLPGAPEQALAGGWTLSAGKTWLRTGFMLQVTDERYFIDGRRIPYFFEGHNRTLGGFLDLRHGLTDQLEAGLQVPYYSIVFNDLAADRTSTGIGDLRLGLRYNLLQAPLIATVGTTVKLPTGRFVNDAEIVPVGEGQVDVELTAELARSFWPRAAYVSGLIGYRLRSKNEETGIDFGDEMIWSLEAGHRLVSRLMFKGFLRGLHGLESTSFGLSISSLQRQIVYFEPGLIFELSPNRSVEVSLPVSLKGKNWPAGKVINVGFFQTF